MHPAYVYAFDKLGYLVTEANSDTFTGDELQAWDDAIEEWERDHPGQPGPD